MAENKKILLARPHPFIAGDMSRFLKENGYQPFPLEDASRLAAQRIEGLAGAVISTAVVSSVKESLLDVCALLKIHHARVPIIFATLIDTGKMIENLARDFRNKGWAGRFIGIQPATEQEGDLGKAGLFLVVHQEDLKQPERKALLARILRKHFP